MPTVLATKILKENQRSLLLHADVSLVEYNAINIEFLPFENLSNIAKAIFTSQNGVKSFLANVRSSAVENCFCVGERTKSLLEENGLKVIKMTEYATELADYLIKNHNKDSFHFFCGNIRSDEIPSKLKENNIAFKEITVYKTTLNLKKFERNFDAILFFSPSGVRSYFEANNKSERPETLSVCIGTTTASEAKNYTENVVIANATTVESVIAKAVKTLKNYD
ncbi:uroporphyrinogen-III synthase [Aequorivita sublithincola DSM 14238]|uniref:Uroporphyrinogen-III synthase n=1 Tax=Aequorivita sublithincola (strain DSM 14238 / LMG 21431 / ACAM 643 / 9-3) TaxID=746697 RepID=I3YUY7_AEQSU|nr:uroporphyrinogen-III synthase [Aequorivita sublithincola]AFL80805.1 uroporphyrinogen-III synthase [Aequorivita sublithincola DSM 14238]